MKELSLDTIYLGSKTIWNYISRYVNISSKLPAFSLKKIGLWIGVGILGILIGLILGLFITPNINFLITFIEGLTNRSLMDNYFINYFPYEFRPVQIIQIIITIMFLSIIFSYFPAARASKLNPATILRHE